MGQNGPEKMSSSRKFSLESRLKSVAVRSLRILRADNSTAEIFLLKSQEMRNLKDKSGLKGGHENPDVLSFVNPPGFPNPEEKKKVIGEIYINKDTAKRDFGRAALLIIHGLLHLAGYSHSRKNDTLRMEKMEKKLMGRIMKHEA